MGAPIMPGTALYHAFEFDHKLLSVGIEEQQLTCLDNPEISPIRNPVSSRDIAIPELPLRATR